MGLGVGEWILLFAAAPVVAFLIHEAGHYITALMCGHKARIGTCELKVWGLSLRQLLTVVEGEMTDTAQRAFAIGGFAFEFVWATIAVALAAYFGGRWAMYAPMQVAVSTAHLVAYPFYNKGNPHNDFNRLA